MDAVASEIERDAAGRFVPGQSGNPAGKRPGTRNRKTVLMAALRDGEGEAAARVVIEKALAGDAVAARFVVSLISPRPRGRTIHLDLPEGDDCNVVAAFNATLRALCEGEITPEEAVTVSRFLDGRRRVLQAWQLEEKLTSYGRTIPGDPPSMSSETACDEADAEDEYGGEDEETESEPDEPEMPLDAELVAAAERAAAMKAGSLASAAPAAASAEPSDPARSSAAESASALQSTCILSAPPAAPPVQTAGISPLPRAIRGFSSIPADRFDAAPAASIAGAIRPIAYRRGSAVQVAAKLLI